MDKKIKKSIVSILTVLSVIAVCPLSACAPREYSEDGVAVVFDYNDGASRPYTVYVSENGNVSEPTTPVLTGYKFGGWQTERDGTGDKITFPLVAKENVSVYAMWEAEIYDITFDYNYDNKKEVIQKEYKSELQEPDSPTRDGYEFFYWQTDGGKQVRFPYTVKSAATFYAKWATGALVRITLDYNYDGVEDGLVRVQQGDALTLQDAGTLKRTGYEFKGWAFDEAGNSMVDFPYIFAENTTIYAVWARQSFTVSFMYNYPDSPGTNFKTEYVEGGSSVSAPDEVPTRTGHTFAGWYPTAKGGEQIVFPLSVSKTTRLYAHWIADKVTTNIFDAELTEFNPEEIFPGYSGSAKGTEIITIDDTDSAHTETYPLNSKKPQHYGHYVTYLYKYGATIKFVIYSDKDVSGVTLKASLGYEILDTGSLTISADGNYGYSFIVNGVALVYNPIRITGENKGAGMFKSTFSEYTVSTNVSLKAGMNVIELVTNNENPEMQGTTGAVAPMVDYIKLEGGATFSWSPVYDNLY